MRLMRDQWPRLPLLLAVLAYVTKVWWMRSGSYAISDGVFMLFRHAHNLGHKHGLVFNAGSQPVEGYDNFPWTVLLTSSTELLRALVCPKRQG